MSRSPDPGPNAQALRHVIDVVNSSDLFDESWYLANYGDAALIGLSAAEHYVRFGAQLMRNPSPRFCTEYYLASNEDVAKAAMDPLFHYIVHGQSEGRFPLPPVDGSTRPPRRGKAASQAPPAASESPGQLSEQQRLAIKAEFDADFYCSRYSLPTGAEPFDYFMRQGWRDGHDPNAEFSSASYLRRRPDITKSRAGVNPFAHHVLHGRRENRRDEAEKRRVARGPYAPKVSVIVPNYNHGRFLAQRIDSILAQTYRNFELLILDDCSSDDSRDVIAEYCRRFPDKIRSSFNDNNAGNVFRQWRKGVEGVDGELVWICESDDFCAIDFLEKLVPYFGDGSVNIAFGRIQFCDRDGQFKAGLDQYREGAEPGIWSQALVRPASKWFSRGFGVNNVIANVGGCLLRRQSLSDAVWSQAESYRVLGDWFLYCHLAGGGQIAYEPEAIAYFRQHGGNTSVTSFSTPGYYAEHQRLMTLLKQRWEIPAATVEKFLEKIAHQYRHFKVADAHGDMSRHVDRQALLAQRRSQPHILISFLGFYPGGGEFFPIYLANALHAQGCVVSMLACRSDDDSDEMRQQLNSAIPVYETSSVQLAGMANFMKQAGVSLIHSHMVSCEWQFFGGDNKAPSPIPYLVTLHGSYEACKVDAGLLASIAAGVTHWVYTAERNLEPFRALGLPQERFSRVPNGMPVDHRPFPQSRRELGLGDETVVFTLVARGILRKGWRAVIEAFVHLRDRNPDRPMHLLLCGDGEEADRHRARHGNDPDMSFLGYQSCISGLYRLTDCAVVPTRFAGESFPLCVIQALQVGTPVIATRVGAIEEMLTPDAAPAGILIEPVRDTVALIEALSGAMEEMLNAPGRASFAQAALQNGQRYAIENVATSYRSLYESLIRAGD